MKTLLAALALMLIATPALARKSCDELKTEIEAKVQANGVKKYTLAIVPNEAVKEQKVVGSCDGGRSKITLKVG